MCLVIARRHVLVVVIMRLCRDLLVRERVGPSVDTNGRRDGGAESGGDEARIAVIQGEVQVALRRRSGARGRVEEGGRYWGPRGSRLAVPFRPTWSSREKSRTGGALSCQAGGTLFGSECKRGMVFVFELGTGGEGAGVLRPRAQRGVAL